jgi:hypothetical protein
MRQKLDVGTLMLALGALLVLIALFLDWYTPGGTAWQSFEFVDLLLATMAVAAILLAATRLVAGEPGTPGWAQALALATLVVVAGELIQPPPGLQGAVREIGAWLAFAGSLVMALGAILHLARISISIDVAERDRRRRVAAVDRRAAGAAGPQRPADEAAPSGQSAPRRRSPLTPDPEDDPGQRTQELRALGDDEPRP